MAEVSLSEAWANIIKMWDVTSYYSTTANISLQATQNVIGAQASIPDVGTTVNPEGNYSQASSLYGFNYNLQGTVNSGFQRTMKTSAVTGDWCNTMFIPFETSYRVMAMNDGGTVLRKNGALVANLASRGSINAFTSLVVGDQI
mgnify:CR=1 FL=1